MPDIFVDFIPDFTKLEAALDSLTHSGVITKDFSDAFKKASATASAEAQNQFEKLGKNMRGVGANIGSALSAGVADGLKKSNTALGANEKQVKQTTSAYESLRGKLQKMITALAEMELAGKRNTQEYVNLAKEAKHVSEALNNVRANIAQLASETRNIDTVIAAAQGVGAAFEIGAGATALFGEKAKLFEETLIKLNAIMLISNGIQHIGELASKRSIIVRQIENIQRRVSIATETAETVAKEKNTVATLLNAGAWRVLNAAMKANPAIFVISGILAVAAALSIFSKKTKEVADATDLLNAKIDSENRILQATQREIDITLQHRLDALKRENAAEDELRQAVVDATKEKIKQNDIIIDERIKGVREIEDAENKAAAGSVVINAEVVKDKQGNFQIIDKATLSSVEYRAILEKNLQKRISDIDDKIVKEGDEKKKKQLEGTKKLYESLGQLFEDNANLELQIDEKETELIVDHSLDRLKRLKAIADREALLAREGSRQKLNAEIQSARLDAQIQNRNANLLLEERLLITAQAQKKIQDLQRAFRVQQLEDQKSDIIAQLGLTKEASKQETELKTQALLKDAQIATENAKGNTAKIKEIWFLAIKQIDKAWEDFYLNDKQKAIQAKIDLIDAELEQFNIGIEAEAILTEKKLEQQRQLELAAVKDNKEKEVEINARYDALIMKNKFEAFQKELDNEIEWEQITNEFRRSHNERIKGDTDKSFQERRQAIQVNAQLERDSLNNQIRQLENFSIIHKQLTNEQEKQLVHLRNRRKELNEEEAAELKQLDKEQLDSLAERIGAAVDAIGSLQSAFSAQHQAVFDQQLDQLQRLRDSGAITEKEFSEREKRLNEAKKRQSIADAQREKALALFGATVQGAKAIIEALPPSPKFFFTIALVAAQIAAIASRPLPKFGKGTKSAPKGLAEVGETGTEIVKTDKGYFITDHPQIIWMKGGERIYNPKETEQMFTHQTPKAKPELMNFRPPAQTQQGINYTKLGKAIGDEIVKHPRTLINLDEEGFSTHIIERSNRTKYKNKRYTFSG